MKKASVIKVLGVFVVCNLVYIIRRSDSKDFIQIIASKIKNLFGIEKAEIRIDETFR